MKKLPFFLPFGACKGRCAYCDQAAITGRSAPPSLFELKEIFSALSEPREICFFGGSFCRFAPETVKGYLDAVRLYAPDGSRIRFSTYPGDLDDPGLLALAAGYPIACIEFGIPSLDPGVLLACRRDANPEQILASLEKIRDACLPIGVQAMIGLPGQTVESSLRDLRRLARVKGPQDWDIRIYPCLVIEGTELDDRMRRGTYSPLSLKGAIEWGASVLNEALALGFRPIRIGLQETDSLNARVTGGPHHPALGELIAAEALARRLAKNSKTGPWAIPFSEISKLTGHGAFGLKRLAKQAGFSETKCKTLIKSRVQVFPSSSKLHS
jgi:histone acetyltransferase (RNA polymerase elongator complex component)